MAQPGSSKHPNNATCPNLTACLDKCSHFNKTSTKTKETEYESLEKRRRRTQRAMPRARQAQAKGKETGTQRCAQEQRRDRERRQKKDERRKHHAVRTHKYGQPGFEPGHSDITPCQPRRHVLQAGEKKQMAEKEEGENREG